MLIRIFDLLDGIRGVAGPGADATLVAACSRRAHYPRAYGETRNPKGVEGGGGG